MVLVLASAINPKMGLAVLLLFPLDSPFSSDSFNGNGRNSFLLFDCFFNILSFSTLFLFRLAREDEEICVKSRTKMFSRNLRLPSVEKTTNHSKRICLRRSRRLTFRKCFADAALKGEQHKFLFATIIIRELATQDFCLLLEDAPEALDKP